MHATDDRGRRVRLIPQRKLGIFPGIPSPIPLDARHRMFADGQEIQWSREVLIPLVGGLLCIFVWAGLWILLAPRIVNWFTAPPIIKGAIMGIVPSAPLPLLMYVVIRAGRHRVAAIVVKHGFCASCGYSLKDLTAPDGCTVCPECGSAWRLPAPAAA